MSRAALQNKLDQLRLRATETYRLNESSRQHLYRTLSEAYLYWRECQTEPDWLEKQYKRERIDHKPREDNQINFRPLIRLVFGIKTVSGYDNNKCTQWATVLRKLDELYSANAAGYQSNAENKLMADIDALGGITNIVGEDKDTADPAEMLKMKPTEAKEMKRKKLTEDELAKRSIQLLVGSATTGIGTATAKSVVRADENEFVALLGRREKDGAITLLGYTNQPDAINTLAIYATKRNYHLLPDSLRQIAEILAVQVYPYGAQPKSEAAASAWRKRIYYDQLGRYTLKTAKDGKTVKAPVGTPRRLLIRGTKGDIIYSNMRMHCCVVTRCTPSVRLLTKKQNIYLKTEERKFVDISINRNELELLKATPKSSLRSVTGQAYMYDLALVNPFTNQKCTLHFYEQGRKEDNPNSWQGNFIFDAYKPTWRAKVDADWLLKLRADWLDEWFSTLGRNTQLARENNATFQIKLTAHKLAIRYNMDKTNISPFYDLPTKITLPASLKGINVVLRSKDIAPVLYNLADTSVHGAVNISGNEQAIVVEYKTDMGVYQIAIPLAAEYKRKKADKAQSLFQQGA